MQLKKEEFIFYLFLFVALFISSLHFLAHPIRILGMDTSLFYMDEKITLAAYFTTTVSFLTGFLFLLSLDRIKQELMRTLYLGVSVFFFILSLDEYFEVHEYANHMIKTYLTDHSIAGFANFSWVVPLSLIIFAVFAMFSSILYFEKDRSVRLPVALGLLSFFLVIVLEPIGGSTYGRDVYVLFVGLEEGLEMVGGSFFLLAALRKARSIHN